MTGSARIGDHPALVLNADYRPLSYYPLSVWCWQDVIKAVILKRVDVICEYDIFIRSPSFQIRLPSVICLQKFIAPAKNPAFTRFNVFLRDGFQCQYCGAGSDLTFDHLIPRSRGGRTTWDNVVTACSPCNLRKGNKSCEEISLSLDRPPKAPTIRELHLQGRRYPPHFLHESWQDFLYWDVELEA